jgi:hypothetical protein
MGQPGVEPGTSSLSESSGHRTVLPRSKPPIVLFSLLFSSSPCTGPGDRTLRHRIVEPTHSPACSSRVVWVRGFEPPIAGARNRSSARLSHTQMNREVPRTCGLLRRDGRNRTSKDSLMRAAARLEAPRMQEPELNRQSRDYEPRLGPSLPAAPLPGIEPGQQASEACVSIHENRGRAPRVRTRR